MNTPPNLASTTCLVALVTLLLAALFGGPSCTTVAGLMNFGSMTDEEFEDWYPTAAEQIGALVRQAYRDGELSDAEAESAAKELLAVSEGRSAVPANLVDWLGVKGWGAGLLEIALIDLDAELAREGSWGQAGKAMARAQVLAGALALEFAAVAESPPGG